MSKTFILNLLIKILAVGALSACTGSSPTLPQPTSSPSIEVADFTPTSSAAWQQPDVETTPTLTLLPVQEEALRQNAQYHLTAELDYGQHLLSVEEKISYFNNSSDELHELLLMVDAQYYDGVFHLDEITWENGNPVEDFAWEGSILRLPLDQGLAPGEQIGLSISYHLQLPSPTPSPDIRPIPFGYTARQTNLVDWYPFIPPYDPDQGWLAHERGYFGEHLVFEMADFEVRIRLLDQRDDLTIAASSPVRVDGEWYRYEHPHARNFVWSASHLYQVTSEQVGSVTVMAYAFPFDQKAGAAVLETTAEALKLYQELFGTYPREMLSVVEADFLDGMEFDGLYFLSNGFYNIYQGAKHEYLIAIAAHETAHQWWYAQVGNDQALEPWLDEAMCTFSERLFYENLYPESLDWWWQFRIDYYEPKGWVDSTIYNSAGYRAYRDAVYLNGAVFLEELRTLVGDQAFFSFLKDYAANSSGQISNTSHFFTLLKTHTSADITPLVEKYFKQPVYK